MTDPPAPVVAIADVTAATPLGAGHLTATERRALVAILNSGGFTPGQTYKVGRKLFTVDHGPAGKWWARIETPGRDDYDRPVTRVSTVTFRARR